MRNSDSVDAQVTQRSPLTKLPPPRPEIFHPIGTNMKAHSEKYWRSVKLDPPRLPAPQAALNVAY